MQKQFVKIKPHQYPQVGKNMIGIVLDHPWHPNGTEVVTSPILLVDSDIAETKNSIYELVQS